MNVELHIDELVLRGIGTGREHEIRAAIERELAALLGRDGMAGKLQVATTVHHLDVGRVRLQPSSSAETIGAQLAASIHRGLRG